VDKQRLRHYANKIKEEASGLNRKVRARVAGVTFEERQKYLALISTETSVRLERDRRNPYDFYAVKVLAHLREVWAHVGFIPRPMSRLISKSLDDGEVLTVRVIRVKGGFESDQGEFLSYGLEIEIVPERLAV